MHSRADCLTFVYMNQAEGFRVHSNCIACGAANLRSIAGYERHHLGRCGSCGLTFVLRIPEAHELEAFYSRYSYGSDPWISPITIRRYEALLDRFEAYRKTGRIFDTGCGAGHFLAVARRRGWEVYGNEFSPAAVRLCSDKGIAMIQGALTAPEAFPEGVASMQELAGSFDVVTSFEVIEHINNPNEDLQAMRALLRPGGATYITTPNFNALSRFWLKADYNVIGYPEHLTYYTRKSLRAALHRNGFCSTHVVTDGISFTRIAKSRKPSSSHKIGGANAPDEQFRAKTETHWFWKAVKRVANTLFKVTGTGSNLKAFAERRN